MSFQSQMEWNLLNKVVHFVAKVDFMALIFCAVVVTEHTPCNRSLGVGICPLSYECYELSRTCDGIVDCTDGYDEIACKYQLSCLVTARCYASAVLAMSLCPSVRLSVRLSQVGVLLKRQNIGSQKQHHTIPQGLQFSSAKDLRELRPESPPTGAPNAGGVGQNRRLSTNNRLYLENGKR